MRLLCFLLISSFIVGFGLAAPAASVKEDASLGRAGNWRKGAQGSPDLKICSDRAVSEQQNAEAQNDYGWALRQHGELAKAEVYLRKAEAIDSSLPYVHSNLSVVLLDQNNKDGALKEAKLAVNADGKQAIYRVVLGNALVATGNVKQAIEEYGVGIKLQPDYENAYYNLGRALNMDGQVTAAKSALSEALKLDPSDDRVLKLLDQLM